jgi:dipeptidyl aminopeptidase/acylaminoacyl peptidase
LKLSKSDHAVPFPLIHSEYSHHSPHYSKTSNQIVYVSNESGHNEVWVSNTNGANRQQMTELKMGLMSPRWSHDGRSIAFLGYKKSLNGNSLFILNLENKSVRVLETPFRKHFRPTWSADDKALIVAAGNNETELFKLSLETDKVEKIDAIGSRFAIQSDDKRIWFTKGRYQGLWMIDPNIRNSAPIQVLNNEEFVVRYHWDVTDNGIFFQKDNSDNYSINFYDFSNKNISSIIEMPIGTLRRYGSMSYIPNEEKIVFTQSEFPQVDIKKLEHPLLH